MSGISKTFLKEELVFFFFFFFFFFSHLFLFKFLSLYCVYWKKKEEEKNFFYVPPLFFIFVKLLFLLLFKKVFDKNMHIFFLFILGFSNIEHGRSKFAWVKSIMTSKTQALQNKHRDPDSCFFVLFCLYFFFSIIAERLSNGPRFFFVLFLIKKLQFLFSFVSIKKKQQKNKGKYHFILFFFLFFWFEIANLEFKL